MADINVERKSRSMLPLILGLLALAALVFLLMNVLGRDDDRDEVPTTTESTTGTGGTTTTP